MDPITFSLKPTTASSKGVGGGTLKNRIVIQDFDSKIVKIAAESITKEEFEAQPFSDKKLSVFRKTVPVKLGDCYYNVNIRSAAKRLGVTRQQVFDAAAANKFQELLEQESGLRFQETAKKIDQTVQLDTFLENKKTLVAEAKERGFAMFRGYEIHKNGSIEYRIPDRDRVALCFNTREAGHIKIGEAQAVPLEDVPNLTMEQALRICANLYTHDVTYDSIDIYFDPQTGGSCFFGKKAERPDSDKKKAAYQKILSKVSGPIPEAVQRVLEAGYFFKMPALLCALEQAKKAQREDLLPVFCEMAEKNPQESKRVIHDSSRADLDKGGILHRIEIDFDRGEVIVRDIALKEAIDADMRFVWKEAEGQPLSELLKKPLSEQEVQSLVLQILGAVAKLNRLGLYLPGLDASQIFVTKEGHVRFGFVHRAKYDAEQGHENNARNLKKILDSLVKGLGYTAETYYKYLDTLPPTPLFRILQQGLGDAYTREEALELEQYIEANRAAHLARANLRPSKVYLVKFKDEKRTLQFGPGNQVILHTKKELGKGSFKRVRSSINLDTGEELAAGYLIRKNIGNQEELRREAYFYRKLQGKSRIAEMRQLVEIDRPIPLRLKMYCIFKRYKEGTLFKAIRENRFQRPEEQRRIARELLEAAVQLQEAGIIHHDIKPANILLEDGHIRISDFGLSLDAAQPVNGLRGTPLYSAFEYQELRARKKHTPDELQAATSHKLDIWAIGCILYEMRGGTLPPELLNPPSGSDPLDHLIFACLQRDPRERPGAAELLERFGEALR